MFSFINFYGIKETARLNIVFTILEIGGLLAIIVMGLSYLGKVNYFEMPNGFPGVFSGAALIFFAFIGFEAIVKLSEETEHAKKIIPKALILSIIITTVIYVLVAVASVSILGWEALKTSEAPLADVAAAVLGSNAFIALAIIALFSTSNTILMILVTTSRLMYGMGKQFKKLNPLSRIHLKRRTPWIAALICFIVSVIFALIGDITIVAEITNFTIFATFIIINTSLIKLRYNRPKEERPFKAPLSIGKFPVTALLGIITSLFLLINLSLNVILGGIGFLAVGLVIYEFIK